MTDEEKLLCEKAVAKWGFEFQLAMVVEECAELIVAVQKAQRKLNTDDYQERTEKIVNEAVDVGLMLEQLKVMIPIPHIWNRIKLEKVERLRKLLDNEKQVQPFFEGKE